jgi:dienelactone hydrolase
LNLGDLGGMGAVADLVKGVLGRIWPDPVQQATAQLELAKLVQSGDLARMASDSGLALAQIDVNKAEAQTDGLFKGGWRPFVGWTCGGALAWNYMGRPMVLTVAALSGHPVNMPSADMAELMPVLLGMLGLGYLRTKEKLAGAQ